MNDKMIAEELVKISGDLGKREFYASMGRKQYVEMAKILKEHALGNDELIEAIASWFASDNPRFDRNKFIEFVSK